MGHALGLGTSAEWLNLATGANFTGSASTTAYGSQPPLGPLEPSDFKRHHWAMNTMSTVLGTNTPQEALMDPDLTVGTRKLLTKLDAAALTDIGWSVVAPTYDAADFNHDHVVNSTDLGIWKPAFGLTSAGNADADSDTDGADFLLWQRQLGHTTMAVPALAGVPEPSSAAMVAWLVGSLALRTRRRRRT
jgi:hypothetical protein